MTSVHCRRKSNTSQALKNNYYCLAKTILAEKGNRTSLCFLPLLKLNDYKITLTLKQYLNPSLISSTSSVFAKQSVERIWPLKE